MARPESDDPFFIGWADTPPADRRFFLRLGLGLTAGTAGLGAGLAALQRAPGAGSWDPDKVREWRGTVSAAPYAMLRSRDLGGGLPRTALLSCLGKCGVVAQIGALDAQPVVVTGSLIQRGQHSQGEPRVSWKAATTVLQLLSNSEIVVHADVQDAVGLEVDGHRCPIRC